MSYLAYIIQDYVPQTWIEKITSELQKVMLHNKLIYNIKNIWNTEQKGHRVYQFIFKRSEASENNAKNNARRRWPLNG